MAHFSLPVVLRRLSLVSSLLAAIVSVPVHAEDLAELQRLARDGRHAEALPRIDVALAVKPGDPQMLFLKGLILAENNKAEEAMKIFMGLTKDHPLLPEPYNNMAVLYAASGEYEKARATLEAAIRIAPSYAAAHENLGDLYLRLAGRSYEKALQMDGANAMVKSKLKLASSAIARIGDSASARPAPSQRPTGSTTQVGGPAVAAVHSAADAEVAGVIAEWAKAWSAKDVLRYLSFYGSDFELPAGQTRAAWESGRRARILDKGRIKVEAEAPRVSVSGNTATVSFLQVYSSDRYRENTRKTLLLTRQAGEWKIRQETSGG